MSLADKYFIENCRDIIENGVWDTDMVGPLVKLTSLLALGQG